MSHKARLLIPLMHTAIAGSASFMWASKSRLVLRPISQACFPDNCRIYSPLCHTCNTASGVSTFHCVVLYNPLKNNWECCNVAMIWSHMDPLYEVSLSPLELFTRLQLPDPPPLLHLSWLLVLKPTSGWWIILPSRRKETFNLVW